MSKHDDDGVRASERRVLDAAIAGEPVSADDVAMLVGRLGRSRVRSRLAWSLREDRAGSFEEMCDGFVAALGEIRRVEAELVTARKRLAASRAAEASLLRELRRVRAERDEHRQAARNETARRIVLQRQVAEGAV